jgi:hypothetical protein
MVYFTVVISLYNLVLDTIKYQKYKRKRYK